ncbi:MAG: CDP-glycerol glycerophosphotransferase family protein [Saccharofermentans sp.]|nr:CDP-glycerol glycerophosphotransferase family protein [Saccharofermentans sp.]
MMLYIDPGTGSMLFTVIMGAVGAGVYFVRSTYYKVKNSIGKDRQATIDQNKLPIVIYSDHKRYWNVFESVCRELDKRGQNAVFLTSSPDDPALNCDFKHVKCEFIGEGNKGFSKLNLLNAYVVLSTTPSLDVYQWKRSRMVDFYAHILHMVSDATTYRMFGLDYYDAVLLSGDYQEVQLRKLWAGRNISAKEYKVVGNTYMDSLLAKAQQKSDTKACDKKTVLVAPTWGQSGLLSKYGSKLIDALLKTDYRIVIRPHPQSFTAEKTMMDELMRQYPNNDRISWNTDNDNFECLKNADIMISDYSGVIFDFSLVFDKPVLYASAEVNLGFYDAYFLDEPLWTFEILPQIGKPLDESDFPHLGSVIEECINSDIYKDGRDKARRESWMHQGESAGLVADYLIKKYNELAASESNKETKQEDGQ